MPIPSDIETATFPSTRTAHPAAGPDDRPPTTTYHEVNPFSIDYGPLIRKHGGADKTLRSEWEGHLRDYYRRVKLVGRRRNLLDTRSARAELELEDPAFAITDKEQEASFETFCPEETRSETEQKLHRAILARLSRDTEPAGKRVFRAAQAEMERDLEQITKFEADPLWKKYSAPVVVNPLEDALRRAIAALREQIAKPSDLSWHWDPRIALSYCLPAGEPLNVDEPTVAAQPTKPPPATPAKARTAAEIATARA